MRALRLMRPTTPPSSTSMPTLSRASGAVLAALLIAGPAAPAAAQQVVPGRVQPAAVLTLQDNFQRIERYNAAVATANRAAVEGPRARAKSRAWGLVGLAFVGLAAQQYTESTRLMDVGDGTGWETPGMIASLSVGGAIWGGIKYFEHRGTAMQWEASERSNLALARSLFPGRDPAARAGR